MKRTLSLILALLLCLALLAGCGGRTDPPVTTASPAPTPAGTQRAETPAPIGSVGDLGVEVSGPQELVVGSINDVGSMYPGGALMTGRKSMHVLVYEPLFWADPDSGALRPIIGKSYESLGSGKYAVEIFDNVTDSAGNHVTAADVIFSIELYIKDGQNSSVFASLTDYYATGDYTLELVFDPEVMGQFEAFVTYIYIVTYAAWNASPDEMSAEPVATGGYRLVPEESVLGTTYVFEKRADYWQTDEQYICDRNAYCLDRVTIRVITDTTTLAIALQNGEVDFVADIASADRVNFMDVDGKALPGFMMTYGANNAFVHLSFNCSESSPCADENLRRAVACAIDAAACAYTAHGAFGKACTMASNPNLYDVEERMGSEGYFAYDTEAAKAWLEKSDYAGQTLRILVQPNVVVKVSAPLIHQYLESIGIDVELVEYDMAQYRKIEADKTGTQYDIKLHGLQATDDYICKSLQELDSTAKGTGLNGLYIADPELQKLYEAAAAVETNSYDTVKALLDYVEEHCYIYGLYYGPKVFFGAEKISYATSALPEDAVFGAFRIRR